METTVSTRAATAQRGPPVTLRPEFVPQGVTAASCDLSVMKHVFKAFTELIATTRVAVVLTETLVNLRQVFVLAGV